MFFIRRIEGSSMQPALFSGQIVLFKKCRGYKPGQVVAAQAGSREVVKRLLSVGSNKAYLQGDYQTSVDCFVDPVCLRGRLVFKLGVSSGRWTRASGTVNRFRSLLTSKLIQRY